MSECLLSDPVARRILIAMVALGVSGSLLVVLVIARVAKRWSKHGPWVGPFGWEHGDRRVRVLLPLVLAVSLL